MDYKVLIPSAGLGTRLGDLSKNVNKALVSVANKPVISYIIEKFPADIEIVVAIGHKGQLVKDYLELAYPERKITCVEIDNYRGSGSGLGYTILQCEKHLQCPFVFCSNDTMVLEDIPEPNKNWMGYANIQDNKTYRSIQVQDGLVYKICEKEEQCDSQAYIGLAGVYNYQTFWKAMREGINYGSIKEGECFGLGSLLKNRIHAKLFTWYDTGNLEGIEEVKKLYQTDSGPNILEKPNEAIWFVNDRVVKYSFDESFITKRVKRSEKLRGYIPRLTDSRTNMYSYKEIKGNVISEVVTKPLFEDLLVWLEGFWRPLQLNDRKLKSFYNKCENFYKEKTENRITQYYNRFRQKDTAENINDIEVPRLDDLLQKLDWGNLVRGTPVRFHGDLHFENILVAENGNFVLLDWRQDFANLIEYGDIYYDFAKLLHGLIVSHEMVSKEHYKITNDAGIIKYDILRPQKLVECEETLKNFIIESGYDYKKVQILTALIFLNIAPLHHYPYSEFLFYLGKSQLNELLND